MHLKAALLDYNVLNQTHVYNFNSNQDGNKFSQSFA